MEVTEQDGRLRAGDDEDDEDEEQEAKHIVHLMGPASKEEFFLNFTCRTAVTILLIYLTAIGNSLLN